MEPAEEKRFLNKFTVGDGCWEWTAACFWNGYGQMRAEGSHKKAHRLSYTYFVGPIPEGLCVCHRCDNPGCVRPSHLFLGTHQDNMRDREAKGRNQPVPRGEANWTAVLNEEIVRDIRQRSKAGQSGRSIARTLGLNRHTVGDLLRGETWVHVRHDEPRSSSSTP